VAEQARREYAIEESLVRMTDQFHALHLHLTSHEAVVALKLVSAESLERARAVVGDQAVHTEALQSAPFSSTPELAEPLADHAELLGDAVSLFVLLGAAQTGLIEASLVFSRPHLAKRLPAFADQFENIQFNWSRAVTGIAERGTLISAVDNPVIRDELEKVTALLEDLRAASRSLVVELQEDCPRFNCLSEGQILQLITSPNWFSAPPAGVIAAMFPGVAGLITAPDGIPAAADEALLAEAVDSHTTALARLSGSDKPGRAGFTGGDSDSDSGADEASAVRTTRVSSDASTLSQHRYIVAVQGSDGHVLPLVRSVDLVQYAGDAASPELWSELASILSDTLFVTITGAGHHLLTDVTMPLAALKRQRGLVHTSPEAGAAAHPVQALVAASSEQHTLWDSVRPRLAQWVSAWPLQSQLVAVSAEWTATIENALMAVALNAAQAAVLPDTLSASASSGSGAGGAGFAGRYTAGRSLRVTSTNAREAAVSAAVAACAAPLRVVQDALNVRIALLASVARQACAWGSRAMAPVADFTASHHAPGHTVSGSAPALARRVSALIAWHVYARDATCELRAGISSSDGGLASAVSKHAAVHSIQLPMDAIPPELKAAQAAEAQGARGGITEEEEEVWISQHEARVDAAVSRLTLAAGQYLLATHAWSRCAKMHWQLGQLGTESAHVPFPQEDLDVPGGLGVAASAAVEEGGAPVHPWAFLASGTHPLHALLEQAPAPVGAVGRHDVFTAVLRAVTSGDTASLSVLQSLLNGARFGSMTRTDRSEVAPVFNGSDTSYRRVTTGWFSSLGSEAMLEARGGHDASTPVARRGGASRSRGGGMRDSRSGSSRRASARSNKQEQLVAVREQALRFSVGGSLAPYGYELLGGDVAGADASVITPLTDRVFVHMTATMRSHASFAAISGATAEAGAAGEQAVRDLGAMTGRKVAVVNAASLGVSGRPYALLRQLIGEITTGGWLVVSNAHTLPVEALSAFALAAESIQQAILTRKGTANIAGRSVLVHPWAAISVSLSPLGAGNDRTALPLALARAFRPVTALSPAPEVRVALCLAARGFVFAAPLAQRIVSMLRGVLVNAHAAGEAFAGIAATGLLPVALRVAAAAAAAAATLADDVEWSAALATAVLPGHGARGKHSRGKRSGRAGPGAHAVGASSLLGGLAATRLTLPIVLPYSMTNAASCAEASGAGLQQDTATHRTMAAREVGGVPAVPSRSSGSTSGIGLLGPSPLPLTQSTASAVALGELVCLQVAMARTVTPMLPVSCYESVGAAVRDNLSHTDAADMAASLVQSARLANLAASEAATDATGTAASLPPAELLKLWRTARSSLRKARADEVFQAAVVASIEALGLTLTPSLVTTVSSARESLRGASTVALVGGPSSGKTTIVRVLQLALTILHEAGAGGPVHDVYLPLLGAGTHSYASGARGAGSHLAAHVASAHGGKASAHSGGIAMAVSSSWWQFAKAALQRSAAFHSDANAQELHGVLARQASRAHDEDADSYESDNSTGDITEALAAAEERNVLALAATTDAMAQVAQEDMFVPLPHELPVAVSTVLPQAMPLEMLVGNNDATTGQWRDGIVTALLRSAAYGTGEAVAAVRRDQKLSGQLQRLVATAALTSGSSDVVGRWRHTASGNLGLDAAAIVRRVSHDPAAGSSSESSLLPFKGLPSYLQRQWLVLDGHVAGAVGDALAPLLSSGGPSGSVQVLGDGSRLHRPPTMTVWCETPTLAHASPSALASTAIINCEAARTPWRAIAAAWLQYRLPIVTAVALGAGHAASPLGGGRSWRRWPCLSITR
jgi:hypothetical protein